MRRFHRLNGCVLSIFILIHLGNHLAALANPEAHRSWMALFRVVYRQGIIETGLLTLFAIQIILGVRLVLSRGWPSGKWAWAQVLSGGYIAFFLVQHLGVIIYLRLSDPTFDTNFHWAASVVSVDPIRWYFIPYYGLALLAIFTHLAAALHFRGQVIVPISLVFGGFFMAIIVPAVFSGAFYPIELPEAYIIYLQNTFAIIN